MINSTVTTIAVSMPLFRSVLQFATEYPGSWFHQHDPTPAALQREGIQPGSSYRIRGQWSQSLDCPSVVVFGSSALPTSVCQRDHYRMQLSRRQNHGLRVRYVSESC